MPMRKTALICAMVLLVLSSPLLANGNQEFERASQAFSAGNYQQAIALFKQAERRGYNRPVIAYNLGVSYYKLADYKNAEKAFLRAVKSQKLKQIAEYNMGLVYTKLGHKKAAKAWFEAAADPKRYGKLYNNKIGALAQRQITGPKTAGTKIKTTEAALDKLEGAVKLAYGYDDDVTDPIGNVTSLSDNFIETFAYLKLKFDHIHLKLAFYEQNFSKVNGSDFDEKEISLSYPINTRYGKFTPSIHLLDDGLDHNDYLDTTDFRLAYRYRFNKNHTLKARYRYSDIESPDGTYDYLNGTRHQLRVDDLWRTTFGKLRLRYEYETNSRQNDNDATPENFSPTRHTLRVRLKNKLTPYLSMKNELNYRISDYDPAGSDNREDKRLRYQLNLYGNIIDDLQLGLQYRRTDNVSTVASKDYRSNVYQAYLFWFF